jgi:beta-glucosidase
VRNAVPKSQRTETIDRAWADASRSVQERVDALLEVMTLAEKVAQLGSSWPGAQITDNVGPLQETSLAAVPFEEASRHGLGHLTRPLGTRPVEPGDGARRLAGLQRQLIETTRLGIPAIAHEECLTGFTTYGATVFPSPLALASTFDAHAVEDIARLIAEDMRAVGVHQGLSPVVDVVRDYRWGRVEETFGEDPYLVGTLGAACVRGLESAGIVATLKHFAGYSGSQAGRNHAPVPTGPRVMRDVFLPPFEMAVREGARAVMHSYSDVDGLPAAADAGLLTEVLREQWGFDGVVVSDYWGVAFLRSMHRVAASPGAAGALALTAGVDVELPDVSCFGEQLAEQVRDGAVPEALVDRAVRRVLLQKAQLGLLDADWDPDTHDAPDLDSPRNREAARRGAEASVILLSNDGILPLREQRSVALVGPCADDPLPFLGCYSYPNHVLWRYPELGLGIAVPTLRDCLVSELPDEAVVHEPGCPVREPDGSRIEHAVHAARRAEVCIAVVGDLPGLFGRGTSGEGCDVEDLRLPGVQDELVEALLATPTPVVLVVVSGRPYALGAYADRAAAIVQAFLPGAEAGGALAGVLSGRVTPSGKLPVRVPRHTGGQPSTYLAPPLGTDSGVSAIDPRPLFPFGHGLSYTTFGYSDLRLSETEITTSGEVAISCLVTNTGSRAGAEVVQLYFADPVAQVTRPLKQLAGFARVPLEPGRQARVTFRLHADRTAFTGVDLRRIVEPGDIELMVGSSSEDIQLRAQLQMHGPLRVVGHDRMLSTPARIEPR